MDFDDLQPPADWIAVLQFADAISERVANQVEGRGREDLYLRRPFDAVKVIPDTGNIATVVNHKAYKELDMYNVDLYACLDGLIEQYFLRHPLDAIGEGQKSIKHVTQKPGISALQKLFWMYRTARPNARAENASLVSYSSKCMAGLSLDSKVCRWKEVIMKNEIILREVDAKPAVQLEFEEKEKVT